MGEKVENDKGSRWRTNYAGVCYRAGLSCQKTVFGEDGWQLKECVIVGRGDKAFVEDGGHQEKLGFKLSTNLVANFGSRWRWLLYGERTVRYSVHFSMERETVCRRGYCPMREECDGCKRFP